MDSARTGPRAAEDPNNTVMRLLREIEEVRRENSKLQEKLCKAKSVMTVVQRQADEAKAERDRERLRAESLQKSSQQLLRQLKRETAKVNLLERHLSAASWSEQHRHCHSFDAADVHPTNSERGRNLDSQKDISSSGCYAELDQLGERGADETYRESVTFEEGCAKGSVAKAEGNTCSAPETMLSSMGPKEILLDQDGSTPGAGKLPDVDFNDTNLDTEPEMQRSWEFVVQGQHESGGQQDFAPKMVLCYPEDAVERATSRGVACVCARGRRTDKSVPNQDDFVAARHMLIHGGHIALYGVFDGHGPAGHHCAAFVRGALPESLFGQRTLLLRPEDTLREAFRKTQASLLEQPFDTEISGTTAALALVLNLPSPSTEEGSQGGEAWLFVAHVGDSRAILGSHKGGEPSALTVTALTKEHRPDDAEEAERVRQLGGEIRKLRESSSSARVFAAKKDRPGLALTRCFGASAAMECGITAEPEISAYRLRPNIDVLLLLGTDGLFEFCSNTRAASQILKEGVSHESLEALCAASQQQWAQTSYNETVDDITVIAATLPSGHADGRATTPPR